MTLEDRVRELEEQVRFLRSRKFAIGDVIADLPGAVIHVTSINEVSQDGLTPESSGEFKDPPFQRQGVHRNDGSGYMGGHLFDLLDGGTRRVQIKSGYKIDTERDPRDGQLKKVPMWELRMLRDQDLDNPPDSDEILILQASPVGFRLGVPFLGAAQPDPSAPPPAANVERVWDPTGRYFSQIQDDGNFVGYETSIPYDIDPAKTGGTLTVLFDWFSIQLAMKKIK